MDASRDVIDEFEDILEQEHREQTLAVQCAADRLRKLNVAELRVLMAHYCKGEPSDYSDMRKADLVAEIAPELADDEGAF